MGSLNEHAKKCPADGKTKHQCSDMPSDVGDKLRPLTARLLEPYRYVAGTGILAVKHESEGDAVDCHRDTMINSEYPDPFTKSNVTMSLPLTEESKASLQFGCSLKKEHVNGRSGGDIYPGKREPNVPGYDLKLGDVA